MHLDIEFLDGHLDMEIGERGRIKVTQGDATGSPHPIGLQKVEFTFEPIAWGKVTPLDEPGVGLLEVVQVVETDDLLLAPTYDIAARLTNDTRRTLRTERRVRLLATAVEIEIGFEVGQKDKWQRFEQTQLKQPIDWSQAEVSDPSCMSIVIRDERPHLRVTEPKGLPGWVAVTMPNGERVTMSLSGEVVSRRPDDPEPEPEPEPAAPAPAAIAQAPAAQPEVAEAPALAAEPEIAHEPAPAAEPQDEPEPEPALETQDETEDEDVEVPLPASSEASRAEIKGLRHYVASFAGSAAQGDQALATSIKARIEAEVRRVWELLETAPNDDRAELETLFRQATDALPAARKAAQTLGR
jgi:hypothetical protein